MDGYQVEAMAKPTSGSIDRLNGVFYGKSLKFYMEYCRHDYIREVLGFDFEEEAGKGVFMVLSGYKISFLRSLKKGDNFSVTCALFTYKGGLPRLHFKQAIMLNGKVMTKAIFTGTCILASGGRSYLPASITEKIADAPVLNEEV